MVAIPTVISVQQRITTTDLFRDTGATVVTIFLIVLVKGMSSGPY